MTKAFRATFYDEMIDLKMLFIQGKIIKRVVQVS